MVLSYAMYKLTLCIAWNWHVASETRKTESVWDAKHLVGLTAQS